MKNNKVLYGWFDNGKIFYVGIGSRNRASSLHYRNQHCLNKRAKAKRENCFEIKILESGLTFEQACKREIELIDQYGRLDLGTGCLTNMTDGGEGNNYWQGKKRSKETKDKMSKSKKGDKCYLYGKTGEDHPCYGLRGELSPNYGRKHSQETKEKMSESTKGQNHPQYGLTGESSWRYGKTHSEETKQKMKESSWMKGKSSGDHPKAKPVKTPFGIFSCAKAAAEPCGLSKSSIGRRLRDTKNNDYIYL